VKLLLSYIIRDTYTKTDYEIDICEHVWKTT